MKVRMKNRPSDSFVMLPVLRSLPSVKVGGKVVSLRAQDLGLIWLLLSVPPAVALSAGEVESLAGMGRDLRKGCYQRLQAVGVADLVQEKSQDGRFMTTYLDIDCEALRRISTGDGFSGDGKHVAEPTENPRSSDGKPVALYSKSKDLRDKAETVEKRTVCRDESQDWDRRQYSVPEKYRGTDEGMALLALSDIATPECEVAQIERYLKSKKVYFVGAKRFREAARSSWQSRLTKGAGFGKNENGFRQVLAKGIGR